MGYLEDYLYDLLEDDEPVHGQLFYAQDGSLVRFDKVVNWYRFEEDHPQLLYLKAGDLMPKEYGVVSI